MSGIFIGIGIPQSCAGSVAALATPTEEDFLVDDTGDEIVDETGDEILVVTPV